MKLFDSELQYLSELYTRMGTELAKLNGMADGAGVGTLAETIHRNSEIFTRIDQMNTRVFQLAQEWEKLRPHMDGASRAKTQALAGKVRKQAEEISAAIDLHAKALQKRKDEIGRDLAQIQQGSRYLASVNPTAVNYPKFIDSVG
jgi:hypothetical protein